MVMLWFLAWHQFISHFLPSWIAGEGDEEIRMAIVSHICHGILSALMHVAGTTSETGRQDDQLADIGSISIVVHGIPEVNIVFDSEFLLVLSK